MRAIPQEMVVGASKALHLWEEPPEHDLPAVDAGLEIPRSPEDLRAHYDLTISRPTSDMISFRAFDRWLAAVAATRGLTCCLLHDGVVKEAIERLQTGRLYSGFHLDYFALWHVPSSARPRVSRASPDTRKHISQRDKEKHPARKPDQHK